ncbi:MAG: NUDIX domain-containing protein, partial [Candidatus Woesearchaeota archaeon]
MKDHAAILIQTADRFLFIKRSAQKKTLPNIWSFPSGTNENGEDIYQTAVREAYEELGVSVKAEDILATKELPEFGVRLHFVLCSVSSGEPTIQDANEIQEMEWLSFNEF